MIPPQVSHFEDPYPNEEEKASLVRMTKVSLRQVKPQPSFE